MQNDNDVLVVLKNIQDTLNTKCEVYIQVKVLPCASQTKVQSVLEDNTIKIAVSAPREKGRANKELILFCAKLFKIKKENVIIISGQTSSRKLLKITV